MTSEANGTTASYRPELDTRLRDELAIALADADRALYVDGDLRASRLCFERAYQLAEQLGDIEALAGAALGLAGLWVSERRTMIGTVMLETRLQYALSLLDERSSLAFRIRARLAGEADYLRGEMARILAVLDEARATDDPIALADALSLAHHCLLGPDDLPLRRELALELIKISFRTERRSDRLMGLLWRTVDCFVSGDPHAGRVLGELRAQLSQQGHAAVGFVVSAVDVMLAIRAGRLDEAESLIGVCAANGAAAGDIDSEWWPGAQLVTVRWYQGRLAELVPMLLDRVHSSSLSAVDNSVLAALAVAAGLNGDLSEAASCLAALRGADLASLPRSSSWLVTMNGIVEAAYLVDDSELAGEAYELLRPYARLPLIGGLGITCFGSTEQSLGLACLTVGRLDQAIDHLKAAVRHNLALTHWPALVSSRQRLARAYQRRSRGTDAEAARRQLQSARADAAARSIPISADLTADSAAAALATCDRVGRKWRVGWRERGVEIDDSIGMLHLAVLIANPRREIPATDLVAGLASLGAAEAAEAAAVAGDMRATGVLEAAGTRSQPVLDAEAISEYRTYLRYLDGQLDQLHDGDDDEQAARLRAEREWLVGQLASATALGGRPRAFPDDGERARVAVGKAIRRAIARISDADAAVGEHLRQTVRTGARCSYWPA
jgi:tetratricopeptide (TPR) repeat protein